MSRRRVSGLALVVAVLAALVAPAPALTLASGTATDCCGTPASWTTGNKVALGTSATTTSTVWFTVANGITTEVFYPRADVPNMQDMQYIVTDGLTFVDLERDATEHVV
jgi:glucoamylase